MKQVVIPLPEKEGIFCEINYCIQDCLGLHQLSEALGNAIDAKDCLTNNHSQQVAVASYLIALAMGFNTNHADLIHIAGHLHDIGKIGVPDAVLKKQGKFTNEDWKWMKRHSEIGAKIIAPVKVLKSNGGIWEIVLYHHERYDGAGYPVGLEGKDIPIGARIIAVADTLSALIQDRPYRKGRCFDEAVQEIQRHSGAQFDPDVVKTFIEINSKIRGWVEGL